MNTRDQILSDITRVNAGGTIYDIPTHTWHGINRYVYDRIVPGGFLHAVLENDLQGACNSADPVNQKYIYEIVRYLWNNAPARCWGSKTRVNQWLDGTPDCCGNPNWHEGECTECGATTESPVAKW